MRTEGHTHDLLNLSQDLLNWVRPLLIQEDSIMRAIFYISLVYAWRIGVVVGFFYLAVQLLS